MIWSCTNYFFGTNRYFFVQILASVLGLISAMVISLLDYRMLAKLWKLHVPLCVFLVLLTFFIGLQREGADDKAWLQLPGGLTLQPSELLKISFILSFSLHLETVKDDINSLKNVVYLCVHGAIPVLLIHFQGDDGTALVFFVIFLAMIFAAGLSWKYILSGFGVMAAAAPVFWFFIFSPEQQLRIKSLFNPDLDPLGIGYQPILGRISIGAGQLFGQGFDGPHQKIPAIQNDFLFAYIGETLGFVGCISVLAIISTLCMRILKTSKLSRDPLGTYICVGVFTTFAFQSIVNIGMCLSLLPVIGVTLPLFSYGGTSVITMFIGIGLVLSVYMNNKRSYFEE